MTFPQSRTAAKLGLFTLCLTIISIPLSAAGLRAAAVKVDITPQTSQWLIGYDARQSTGVHDKIFHRILAVDDGQTRFFLVASDLCLFSPSVYDEVAAQLHDQLGIPRENFWWSVTHTHSAPEVGAPIMYRALLGRSTHEWSREYTTEIINSLISGIKEATAKLEPTTLHIGTGTSRANINRRAKDVDGTVTLGVNPDGPADHQIGLLSFTRPDGSIIAAVANFAMHGTVLNLHNLEISGDGPGVVAAYVEEKIGAPMLYVNGAAGNVAPIYSVYPTPQSGHLSQFRVLLGDPIIAALKDLEAQPANTHLLVREITVETPIKPGFQWPEELKGYTASDAGGATRARLPVRILKINDTAIWSAPTELFCEISMNIRSQAPFANVFYFGYTNGWLGYWPTAAAFREGGYEPKTSPFTEAAEEDLQKTAAAGLRKIKAETEP